MSEQLTPPVNAKEVHNINHNPLLFTSKLAEDNGNVDLNFVIKEVFAEQRKKLDELKVICRCDVLPTVFTNVRKLKQVLTALLGSILSNPPADNKLFLYIKCDVKATEVLDLLKPIAYNYFQLSFHANTNVCKTSSFEKYWQECEAIVQTLPDSKLSLSHTNTGCLFSITLPGKLN